MNYLENVSVKIHKTTILENISLNTSANQKLPLLDQME